MLEACKRVQDAQTTRQSTVACRNMYEACVRFVDDDTQPARHRINVAMTLPAMFAALPPNPK
jgi:hypothetical protein